MIVFADSSALVTHYDPTEEDVLPTQETVVLSALARVEVVSALWRKAGSRNVDAADARTIVGAFEGDWADYRAVGLAAPVLERAARITTTHGLRTLDAIQLASALAARDAEPECRTMVVLDDRLRRAAAAERFDILPV